MKVASDRRLFTGILLLSAMVWAVCARFDVAGQRKLFYEGGKEEMYDYWMPRMCLEQGYAPANDGRLSGWYEGKFITGDLDKVYPALALLPYKLFPATRTGAWCFSILGSLIFLATLSLVANHCQEFHVSCFMLHVSCLSLSMPFLFALERGNPIWLSAAAVAVFLAWWDDPIPRRRYVAAVCLAVAAVMKIAPAALGLLYVGKILNRAEDVDDAGILELRPRASALTEPLIAFVAAVVLFLVPWFFVPEGFSAIPIMIRNAAHHADFVLRTADFGLVQPWRAVRVALGLDALEPWPGMYVAARLSQLFGFLALFIGARRRDCLLLVGGMLLAAGNMYYYGALYLLPVFILEFTRPSPPPPPVSTSLPTPTPPLYTYLPWFVILCPLQLVLFGHSGNAILCNLALMAMMSFRLIA